mmetsp:Transcript_4868/g.11400  ORF Transcript_4868/g.11400 Transcript_4868/m.11400 type:complete len:209 (-) Transcript_4868:1386-2012(-)
MRLEDYGAKADGHCQGQAGELRDESREEVRRSQRVEDGRHAAALVDNKHHVHLPQHRLVRRPTQGLRVVVGQRHVELVDVHAADGRGLRLHGVDLKGRLADVGLGQAEFDLVGVRVRRREGRHEGVPSVRRGEAHSVASGSEADAAVGQLDAVRGDAESEQRDVGGGVRPTALVSRYCSESNLDGGDGVRNHRQLDVGVGGAGGLSSA